MKPLLAGILAAAAILTGWSINTAIDDQQPLTIVTDPPAPIAYVAITDPPATTSSSTTSSTISSTSTTTTFVPALLPVDHVCYDWLPLLLETGWPTDPEILGTALTIMWRESRCQPDADSGPDHGLFQINRYWCRPSRYTPNGWLQDRQLVVDCDSLFDPATNVASALAIWHYSEDRNGDGFLPWTTYSGRP